MRLTKDNVGQLIRKNYSPHAGQQAFHDARGHRFRVMSCGRRWGKDFATFQEALVVGLTYPNSSIPVITPTSKQGKGIFRMAQSNIDRRFYGGDDGIKKQAREIQLVNGSIIRFISAESQNTFRGLGQDVRMLIVDESAYVSSDVWVEARPLLSDNSAPAVFISTPNRDTPRNWFYDFFMRGQKYVERICPVCDGDGCDKCEGTGKIKEENPDYDSRYWSYRGSSYENTKPNGGYLEEQEIKDLEVDLNSQEDVDREVYGKFTETSGAFFSVDGIETCINYNRRGSDQTLEATDDGKYVMGVDPARSQDYTGLVVIDDKHKVMHVKAFQGNWSSQINKIKSVWKRYGEHTPIYIDATREENLVLNLKDKGVRNIKPVNFASKGTKSDMFFFLQGMINDRTIELPYHKTLRSQLLQITSKQLASGIRIEAAEGHDDLVDALALAVWGASDNRKTGSGINVFVA